jgi:hypothetical protein
VSAYLGYLDEARAAERRVVALLERLQHPPELVVSHQLMLAMIAFRESRFEDGLRDTEEAYAMQTRLWPDDVSGLLQPLTYLCIFRSLAGNVEDAAWACDHAIATLTYLYGSTHFRFIMLYEHRAEVAAQQRRPLDAIADIDRALAMIDTVYGRDHEMLVATLTTRARLESRAPAHRKPRRGFSRAARPHTQGMKPAAQPHELERDQITW